LFFNPSITMANTCFLAVLLRKLKRYLIAEL
jgi:hypothetical protein